MMTCRVKTCKDPSLSFPLRFEDVELEQDSAIDAENTAEIEMADGEDSEPKNKKKASAADSDDEEDEDEEDDEEDSDVDPEEQQETLERGLLLIKRMLPRLSYPAILKTATQLGMAEGLPTDLPANAEKNEELMKRLRNLLVLTEVTSGKMVCDGCGRVYPIVDGIPNMLLSETEI
ncbi:hypothetical protein GQ42DRAFT_159795 [Ramicandelaber brevisporus]|nr:hypothetical protein GQ42DRAFT_159795 [Ramicandelaber brevisporus]